MLFTLILSTLSLASVGRAWPQISTHYPRSLPVSDDSDTLATLHIVKNARALPSGDDAGSSLTLPVPHKPRHLPVDQDPGRSLTLPVIHAPRSGLVGRGVELQLENRSDVAYYAQVDIGNPPQAIYAQIDTGSFEFWVNPDCSTLSASDEVFCEAVGHYNPSKSSSSVLSKAKSTLTYGIGSADITYVSDDIALSDSDKIKGMRFGVASKSQDQWAGILGLGHGHGVNTKYKNFMDELVDQNVIDTKTFSLALGGKHEEEGVLAFGGVDTSKFEGKLASLPILPADESPDGVARYWVSMESMSLSPPKGSKITWPGSDIPVFLDSGATLTLLPPDLVEEIAADFSSDEQDDSGYYIVDCDLVDADGSVDFAFDGITISVSYREIIRKIHQDEPSCYLGIVPSTDFALLGDTFLRSAYVVFDLENEMVHMAPYTNCGSTLKTISDVSDLSGLSGSCGSSSVSEDENSEVMSTSTSTTASLPKSSETASVTTSAALEKTSAEASPSTSAAAATAVTTSTLLTRVSSTSSSDQSTATGAVASTSVTESHQTQTSAQTSAQPPAGQTSSSQEDAASDSGGEDGTDNNGNVGAAGKLPMDKWAVIATAVLAVLYLVML